MQITVEEVTPKTAERWLRRNTLNRNISPGRVGRYVREMRAGNWRLNGDAIRFYADGGLADGQHRLQAVVASGITIETVVVRGLESDILHTLDQGRTRQRHDILRMSGYSNATRLASALKYVVGELYHGDPTKCDVTHYRDHLYSSQAVLDLLDGNPEVAQVANEVGKYSKAVRLLTPGTATALLWLTRRADPEDAHVFFSDLDSGADLAATDPVYHLRERIIRERSGVHLPLRNLAPLLMNLTASAWNMRRRGAGCRRIVARPDWPGLK